MLGCLVFVVFVAETTTFHRVCVCLATTFLKRLHQHDEKPRGYFPAQEPPIFLFVLQMRTVVARSTETIWSRLSLCIGVKWPAACSPVHFGFRYLIGYFSLQTTVVPHSYSKFEGGIIVRE